MKIHGSLKQLMMSTGKDVCSQLYVIQERLLQAPDYMSTLASRHSSMVNLRSCLAANDSSSSLTRLALDLTGQSARVRGSGAREEAGMAGGAPGQGEPACMPVQSFLLLLSLPFLSSFTFLFFFSLFSMIFIFLFFVLLSLTSFFLTRPLPNLFSSSSFLVFSFSSLLFLFFYSCLPFYKFSSPSF